MSGPKKKSRRRFILGGLGVAGALIVGWGVMPPRQRLNGAHPLPVADGEVALNGWIKISKDGTVAVAMHRSEMGQGVHTALQMLVAEELDVPLHMIKPVYAPIDKIYGNVSMLADGLPFHPDNTGAVKRTAQWLTSKTARELGLQVTGGSSSVKDAWGPMREAGAAARAMLVAAAAQDWGVPAGECKTSNGTVSHASGKQAGYGDLAAKAAQAAPKDIRLKNVSDFTLIGTPQPRTDAAGKANGTAAFGIDARPAGLLFAAVKMSPVLGGKIKSINRDAVTSLTGVLQVVDFSNETTGAGVAVIAKSYWTAKQAIDALPVEWDAGQHATLSTADVFRELSSKLDTEPGFAYYETGDIKNDAGKVKTVTAEYRAPFLAHAAMEPINCTAQVTSDGKLNLWVSTQAPSIAVDMAARTAKLKAEDVNLHMSYLGGGFGRRLEVDMVVQAVLVAMQARGAPVQLIWSREEDTTHDVYRPAALARFSASLDANGHVLTYENKSASGSVTHQVLKRSFGLPGAGPDKTTAEGEFDMQYEFANQRIAHIIVPTPVPLGFWRSVGHSHNAFFKESFIDELAAAAGKHPVAFRRELLKNHPRHLAVLNAAVEKAGQPEAGRAHGVALHQSFGTIVAEVAEVSIQDNEIKVHKVVCAVDCGIAVNPNIIAQQMESAVIFGLSAALYGEITLKDGKVEQQNFHNYPVLRMSQAPLVETVIIKSAEPPEGIGEPGTPPIAPAVANAVFALTAKRLRSLPLRLA
ncbi:xanthine dehydrogenase family protein molybdopterin-binding subunit [Undibacterium sp.]|jgi:isoquinoline 1-oxidoreductase beta subunit|uniref:xanthine dehydrogenase family protein molybdopterin-binding subunit n=1 Tax=Undibacterium sp. TaxID=1914977 RepID=UPI002C4592E0|nr:molybdopterin cofactor-binding domain-containing protein [Undibacterium sp.]HTD02345.1 molybdopterin cofactor-binding domain-containing protein [Undibacterium sp.]